MILAMLDYPAFDGGYSRIRAPMPRENNKASIHQKVTPFAIIRLRLSFFEFLDLSPKPLILLLQILVCLASLRRRFLVAFNDMVVGQVDAA